MAVNERLAALMREAGFLKDDGSVGLKRFARAVSQHAGKRAPYTHTYVNRWLSGTVPRDGQTPRAMAAALGEQLGRTVAVDELGFRASDNLPAGLGISYPDSSASGIATVTRLWQADLDEVHALLKAPVNIAAWNEASLSWLVGAAGRVQENSKGRLVS